MATYIATVDARVIRTVTVEADTVKQAATEAQAEVMAQMFTQKPAFDSLLIYA